MKTITIEAQRRQNVGKSATRDLRNMEHVPCVIYGGKETIHFHAPVKSFKELIYSPEFYKVNIDLEGTTYEAVIKEVQYHPVKDSIQHIDFIQLVPNKPVITEIPVKLEGLAAGVRNGGKLALKVRKLGVRIMPDKLVEKIVVDVTHLKLGKSIRVSEIKLPEGIDILNSPGIPVASCEIPRALKSAASKGEDAEDSEEEVEKETE